MPIQKNIQVCIACPGKVKVVEDTNPRAGAPASSVGESSSTVTTTSVQVGPTLTRRDSTLDLTETTATAAMRTSVTSANGTVEEVFYTDEAGNRLEFRGTYFVAREYDPNAHSISGAINPGPSVYPSITSTATPLATPLVKFVKSLSNTQFCIVVKVLPGYAFEDPEHDFLRITVYLDGQKRVVRTVSARQLARLGAGSQWSAAINGVVEEKYVAGEKKWMGRDFVWRDIEVDEDEEIEPQDHDEWNYNLGTIRVYIERMRTEEGGAGGEDAGSTEQVEDNDDEVDADDAAGWETVSDDDGETEDAESEESEEDEQDVVLHKINVQERCLSHFTAYVETSLLIYSTTGREITC